jgi:hypothetical protein
MATDDPSYRPVSAAAVAAAIVGGLSALAVVSPFFWILPLVGVAVSWLGLADVCRPGAEKAGRGAALVGLALAVGFGAQALSTAATARLITAGRARVVAERWLEEIRERRTADAESMCQPAAAAAVTAIAAKLAACPAAAFRLRVDGASEDVPGGIVVRATAAPCAAGGVATAIDARIHLVAEAAVRQGRAAERWMIARCVID